jgi:glutathione S-transferase
LQVLLAALEKGVKFKRHLVSLFHGQHMEPWYVKLNPEGTHIPVLVHGKVILNSPENIIDYLDTLGSGKCVCVCFFVCLVVVFFRGGRGEGWRDH